MASVSAGAPRRYRGLETLKARRGGDFTEMLADAWALLHDQTRWCHLSMSESTSTDIFRLVLRPAAVIYHNFILQYDAFPLALLELLESDAVAPSLLRAKQEKDCLLDDYSREFLNKHPSVAELTSSVSKAEL